MIEEEAALVRELAERIFADHCDRETVAAARSGVWAETLWNELETSGLTLALVPEERGGSGLPFASALPLIEIAAEFAAPIPLAETMIAAWLLSRAGIDVPSGPLTFAAFTGRATSAAGEWRISGESAQVPWGRNAGVVALFESDVGPRLLLLKADTVLVDHGFNIAGEPRDLLIVEIVANSASAPASPVSGEELQALGAAIRTMQIAGALKRATALTVEYARDRIQFGRSLSKFQAIQQSLAVLATQSAVAMMAAALARDAVGCDCHLFDIAIAKARAGEAASIGAAIAHQIHGAIGFTLEYDLQFFSKRLYAWRDEFGNEAEWNLFYGRHLLGSQPGELWQTITSAV